MPGVDDVFTALSDPTRREVLRSLSERPELTASRLAGELQITRQAVAKHLAALQHWKTYVRHLLLERSPNGGHLLRNLVHVCDGPDADYLTRLCTEKERPHG